MTTSTWNVSASGDWSDAADWTGGVPNSSSATATIAESGTYTVDIASAETFSVGSVTLNDAGATLDVAGTLNLTNTLTLTAGDLDLTGKINGGTINASGGEFTSSSGTLNGVTVDGTIALGGGFLGLTVTGGLSMNGAGGTGAGTIDVGSRYLVLDGAQTISNATIDLNYAGQIDLNGTGVTTLAANTTLDIGAASSLNTASTASFVNDGTIDVTTAGSLAAFAVQTNGFTNAGSLALTDGAMTVYATSFSNTGTLSLDGNSSLQIYTELTSAQWGTVNLASGAFVGFDQTLDNRGATFNDPAGVTVLGSIEGGTIEGVLNLDAPYPSSFSNTLTLSGSPTLEGAGGTGNGTINDTGDYADLFLSGTETIRGATINIGNDIYQDLIAVEGGGTVTLASSTKIVAAVTGGYYSTPTLAGAGAVINDGTIQAEQSNGSFLIDPTTFTNGGTITVANGTTLNVDLTGNTGTISVDGTSTVNFTSELTTAQLGTVKASSGAILDFSGTLNNSGATYNTTTGVYVFGTINGGTIDGTINLNNPNTSNALTLTGGPTLNGAGGTGVATIDANGTNSGLFLAGTETLNNVTINVGSSQYVGTAIVNAGTGTVTLGSNVTIDQSAAGTNAFLGYDVGYPTTSSGPIVNAGTIDAASKGGQFTIDPTGFTNTGTIAVSDGDTLNLNSTNYSNTGKITVDATSTVDFQMTVTASELGTVTLASGAILEFGGGLNNAGATYVVPAGANLEGTVVGGKIEGPLDLGAANQTLTLDGVTVTGSNGSGAGTININAEGATLTIAPSTTLSNVTVDFDSTDRYNLGALNADGATIGASVTINVSASGAFAAIQGNTVNDGTINVSTNGGYLEVGADIYNSVSFTNDGKIFVTDGATFYFGGYNSTVANNGTISVDGTSSLYIGAPITTAEFGGISLASGATLGIDLNNTGATFVVPTGVVLSGTITGGTIEGTISLTPNTEGGIPSLTLSGDQTFEGAGGSGPGVINDTAAMSELNLSAPATLSNLTINIGNSENSYIVNNTQDLVTFASNVTIDQSATGTTASIQVLPYEDNGQGEIINDGSIVAGASSGTFNIQGLTFVNAGAISVSNGDTLDIGQNMGLNYFSWFTNTGTISIDGTSTVKFLAEVTLAQIGTIDAASGATIDFSGTLDNTGATFTVPTGAIIEGTILGGTIAGTLDLTAASQTLTLIGPMAFTGENGTGSATINVTGAGSQLLSQVGTYANVTINIGNASSQGAAIDDEDSSDTFASSVTINQSAAGTTAYIEGQAVVFNYGSILAASSGGTFVMDPAAIQNFGTISDSNGDLVILDPNQFGNMGTITQTGAGSAMFLGPDANIPSITNFGFIGNSGSIIAGASGAAIGIDPEEFDNTGSIVATKGGEVLIGPETFDNLPGTALAGGTYEVDANSTFEFINFTTIVTDNATIILSGANSVMEQENPTTKKILTLDSTVTSTGSGGTLEILGGRNWSQTTAFTNAGTIQLGGGTFQVSSLTSSGTIDGFGTVSEAVSNTGALIALGGTLNVQDGTLSGYSGGTLSNVTLGAGANATLQLPGNVSIATLDGTIELLGANAAIQSGSVTVQSTLKTIGASGVLEIGDSYASSNAISNAGTIQMAGGTLSTGTLTDSAGSKLDGYGTVASVFADSGSVSSSGGALVFTASGDTFAGTLGGQEIDFGGGTDAIQSGSSLTAATLAVYGNASVTFAANENYAGTLNLGAGTLNFGANSLTLSGTGSTIAGAISSTGTLTFAGGSQAINSGASLSVSNWTLSGGDATTINTSLSYGKVFTDGAGTTLTIASGDTLSLNGAGPTIAGAIGGAGGLSLSGGSQAINRGASLTTAHWSLAGTDTASLNENLAYGGAFSTASGTTLTLASGDTLSLSGSSIFAGKVSGSGATLAFVGGSQSINSGASLGVSNWSLSGNASTTVGESLSYAGSFSAGAGTNLAVVLNDTLTLTGASSFAGSISGKGTLSISGGADTFDGGAHFGTALNLLGGATVAVDGAVSISGNLTQAAGTGVTIGTGDTLTLSGSSILTGAINGAGTLAFVGKGGTFRAGSSLSVSNLSLTSDATMALKTTLAYAGELSEASGTLALGAYSLNLSGAGSTIAGTISGTGGLALTGGSQAFDSGAVLKEGSWSMSGSDVAAINENLTFAGTFAQGVGTTLTIASGDTLSLTGTSTLRGTVNGAGTLDLSHATASGLAVGGTVTLDDVGTVLQTGQITFGDALGNAATLSIATGASYEINGNVGIAIGTSPSSAIDDNGLLIKNGGTGVTKIAVGIVDNGHIEASIGTLDLTQAVTGSGAMQVDAGATLEFGSSAASTLAMTFNGANATLALASPSSFAATIAGFAAGDSIDLLAMKATAAVLEGNDQLLITKGANTIATLQLSGSYTGYTFSTASDDHGGTDITATAPGSHTDVDLDDALTAATHRQFDAHLADWHLG